jgi:uncharacterized protein YchJ
MTNCNEITKTIVYNREKRNNRSLIVTKAKKKLDGKIKQKQNYLFIHNKDLYKISFYIDVTVLALDISECACNSGKSWKRISSRII